MKTMHLLSILAAVSVFGFSVVAGNRVIAAPQATASLDADEAAQLAATLANAEARRSFDSAPFKAAQSAPKLSEGRWQWQATAGYGKGDLQAIVSFTPNGSEPKVVLKSLVLEIQQKAMNLDQPRFKER